MATLEVLLSGGEFERSRVDTFTRAIVRSLATGAHTQTQRHNTQATLSKLMLVVQKYSGTNCISTTITITTFAITISSLSSSPFRSPSPSPFVQGYLKLCLSVLRPSWLQKSPFGQCLQHFLIFESFKEHRRFSNAPRDTTLLGMWS